MEEKVTLSITGKALSKIWKNGNHENGVFTNHSRTYSRNH